MGDILVIVEHRDGVVADATFELLGLARSLADGGGVTAAACAADGSPLVSQLGAADRVVLVEDAGLAEFTPTAWLAALAPLVRERSPQLVLVANSGSGMDVAAGLSGATGLPLAAYATAVTIDAGGPLVRSGLYSGKVVARSRFRGGRGIVTVVAGSSAADSGRRAGRPAVERVAPAGRDARVRFRALHRPAAGDVDITRQAVLVSVGRGVAEADNIALVEELAAALGGAVAASRPVADAGWLPRTRQVGKSGLRVKPKLYLALGISGAPEHLEGMRGADLIIAVNTDPRAPIFGVAHYGAVADLLDVVPALTARLRG